MTNTDLEKLNAMSAELASADEVNSAVINCTSTQLEVTMNTVISSATRVDYKIVLPKDLSAQILAELQKYYQVEYDKKKSTYDAVTVKI